jgi:acyl-ACP thioesterase
MVTWSRLNRETRKLLRCLLPDDLIDKMNWAEQKDKATAEKYSYME